MERSKSVAGAGEGRQGNVHDHPRKESKRRPRPDTAEIRLVLNFRQRAIRGLAYLSTLILTPFCVNNFIQGRALLGVGSGLIVTLALILFKNAGRTRHDETSPWATALWVSILAFLSVSLQQQGAIGAYWCYPSISALYIIFPERRAWIANTILVAVVTPQAWFVVPGTEVVRIAATLVAVSGFTVVFVRVITDQQDHLQRMAATDPLTGLLNRKTLGETLEHASAQHERSGSPMTLLALDIDHFKQINDTRGHDAGDRVLCKIADTLLGRVRRIDKVFRVGGEEFLVLLWNTDGEGGGRIADEFRTGLQSTDALPGRPVTVSVGVAMLRPGETWTHWIKRADDNLYRAKAEGRNRVVA